MKRQLLVKARKPVPSGRDAHSARVLPARACFGPKRTTKGFAVRGSAQPGLCARRCSPPTTTTEKNVNNSALIDGPSMRQGRLSSYERENYNRTLEPGILFTDRFSCVASTPFAQIDIQNPESWATEARQILAAKVNRQLPMDSSPGVPTERRCASLAEPAALCCQGSAPASPPPLTAAAFRPRLLLGSGFGEFKAGALSFQREHECLTMQRTAVAAKVLTQLLESHPRTVRSGSRVTARSATIGKPSPFPLAFRVALLASSKVRWNFSGQRVALGRPGPAFRRSGRRAGLHENALHFLLSHVRCGARRLFAVVACSCHLLCRRHPSSARKQLEVQREHQSGTRREAVWSKINVT